MEPSEWTGGRRILAPRGKTLGGSSSINGHVYNRGQRMDFDTWAQLGNRGWGYADVLPYFRRMERRIGDGDDTYRGRDGALTVTDIDWRHPLCEAFIEGAVSLGIPRNPDYNGAIQEGVVLRPAHHRQRPPRQRGHGLPASGDASAAMSTCARMRTSPGSCSKASAPSACATARRPRRRRRSEVRAGEEVILSGGAYNSPQLLQLSGIGPPELLQVARHPRAPRAAGVGENLRDHYAPRFVARVKNIDTINELRARPARSRGEVAEMG